MIRPDTRRKIRQALLEDIGRGDITSQLLVPVAAKGKAVILAREPGIFFGEETVREIFRTADKHLKIDFLIKDGKKFRANEVLIRVSGSIRSILKAERTALNLLGHLCGI